MSRPHTALSIALPVADLAPPCWPACIRLEPFAPQKHATALHALPVDAYRDGGGSVAASGPWCDTVRGDADDGPSAVFLAGDVRGALAAAALCWRDGFLKDLVVARAHRRRGLTEALLRHCFTVFTGRGAKTVMLKVENKNPSGAERLYRRLGMRPAPAP